LEAQVDLLVGLNHPEVVVQQLQNHPQVVAQQSPSHRSVVAQLVAAAVERLAIRNLLPAWLKKVSR
jgi:hypothetical protein